MDDGDEPCAGPVKIGCDGTVSKVADMCELRDASTSNAAASDFTDGACAVSTGTCDGCTSGAGWVGNFDISDDADTAAGMGMAATEGDGSTVMFGGTDMYAYIPSFRAPEVETVLGAIIATG